MKRCYIEEYRSDCLRTLCQHYIQHHFSFVAFEVAEKTDRLRLESRIISTVSGCQACRPSETWLGYQSPKAKIRQSGLWQVNQLYKEPLSAQELEQLSTIVNKKLKGDRK